MTLTGCYYVMSCVNYNYNLVHVWKLEYTLYFGSHYSLDWTTGLKTIYFLAQ